MGRDLAPGREPNVVPAADVGGDRLERPSTRRPPVDMGMGSDVDHDGFAFVLKHTVPWRAPEAHGVRQIVDIHGERDGDDPSGVERSPRARH
jgi:hypothetical protein